VGSVDRRALVRESEDGWLFSGRCLRVRLDRNKADPAYISYQFGTESFKELMRSIAVGATMPSINTKILSDIELLLPSLTEQKKAGSLLMALDDKIELNKRMNDTLEGIAKALFKSWFVDFDPVKAKAEGGTPEGMYDDIAVLFPTAFTESILRPIPEGWKISEIGKEVEVVGGSTPSTQESAYWEDGEFYWATPKDLSKLESPILLDTERKITKLGVTQISSGQLPVDTVLLSSRAPVGYIALAKVPVSINQGFIAMKCVNRLSPYFMLNWTYSSLEEIRARATGTTFAEISKSAFRPIKVIVPDESIIKIFNGITKPIYDRIAENERIMSSLVDTRDLLLPQLISGKLHISDLPKETTDS
jgi:type I restriction enzyme S subunit